MSSPLQYSLSSSRGMTLLEVLAVIGVIVIILGLIAPSLSGVQRAQQLSTHGALLRDQMLLARQKAISENRTIYLHFSQEEGIFVLSALNENGVMRPVDSPVRLPQGIVLCSAPEWTSLMRLPIDMLTIAGKAIPCRRVGFRASGRTDLSPDSRWHLTLLAGNDRSDPGSQFLLLAVDPITARIHPYQP